MTLRIPFAELKAATHLPTLIGEDLALRREGRLWSGLCPFHGERTPSFYVWPDHFHCFGCAERGDVFDWLQKTRRMTLQEAIRFLGGDASADRPRVAPPPRRDPEADEQKRRRRAELAAAIWREAVPGIGTPAEAYLRGRGLAVPDDAPIRFHPRCPCGPDGDRLPAMLALLTDALTGNPTGVHRTFLAIHGANATKAAIDRPKKMLGQAGVIRLMPDAHVGIGLGLAEGVETALAVMQMIGWGPCWAACSAGGIAKFPVLLGIDSLAIFPDADDSGVSLKAARACADRWADAGREAHIHIPPPGTDWLDAMLALARRAAA